MRKTSEEINKKTLESPGKSKNHQPAAKKREKPFEVTHISYFLLVKYQLPIGREPEQHTW